MKKNARKVLFLVILAILLAIPAGMALAKELGALTISGPGINGEITLDDPEQMRNLEGAGLLEQSRAVTAPGGLVEGYILTLFLNVEEGLQPWLQVTYYPNSSDESGYLNVVDLMEEATNQADGRWYLAAPQAESALRALLSAHGASFAVPAEVEKAEAIESPAQLKEAPAVSAKAEAVQDQMPQSGQSVMSELPAQEVQPAASQPSVPAFNPGMIWVASLIAAFLLALIPIRLLAARQNDRIVK